MSTIIGDKRLKDLLYRILLALPTPAHIADTVAGILVNSNMSGVDSHGCRLLPRYVDLALKGVIVPDAEPEVVHRQGAAVWVDGHWGFGQLAAHTAARLAVEVAREFCIGAASLNNVYHIGRVGEFTEQIAREGMLGLAFCNAVPTTVAFGSRKRIFGTNPIAMAAPRQNGSILASDFATSVKSVNKVQLAREHKEQLAPGTILDKNGLPSTDPNAYFDGGALLPVGGYKGYAFNLFVDIVGGLLVGAGCGYAQKDHQSNGTFILAVDIAAWRPLDEFTRGLEELLAEIKAAPPAPGFDEVLLPGELEERLAADRRRNGIALDDATWRELRATWVKLGLPEAEFAP